MKDVQATIREKPLALKRGHPAHENNIVSPLFFSLWPLIKYLSLQMIGGGGGSILPTPGSGSSPPKSMRIHADRIQINYQQHWFFLWIITGNTGNLASTRWTEQGVSKKSSQLGKKLQDEWAAPHYLLSTFFSPCSSVKIVYNYGH
jgi:hypothetical protein